jgi:hypothetical protein
MKQNTKHTFETCQPEKLERFFKEEALYNHIYINMKILKQIGILSGIALMGAAAIIPFTTSCKKESPVVIPEIIDQATFDDNEQYQISGNTTIYTSSTSTTTTSHNLFFDLSKFATDNNNATDFVIEGTINFGILVGFNENVNLYGENESLINLTDQSATIYGILVGSIDSGQSTYTGNMHIDESVSTKIISWSVAYGVYFDSIVVGSVTINGDFSVQGFATTYGVRFNSTAFGSTQNINGNFSLTSST